MPGGMWNYGAYFGRCGAGNKLVRKSKDRRLSEIAFEAYDLFCRSLSVCYSAGTDFIQIADHSYWLYNPEENTGWEDMFPVSPVCDLCGIVLYVLGKAGGVC